MTSRRGQDFKGRKLLLETLTKGISKERKEQKLNSSLVHPTGSLSVSLRQEHSFYAAVKATGQVRSSLFCATYCLGHFAKSLPWAAADL